MTQAQGYAKELSRSYGIEFAHYHPELADLYIAGAPATHLARGYSEELAFLFPTISDASHRSIVMNALRTLIKPEALKEIGREHMISGGLQTKDLKIGMHGLTDEERSAARFRGALCGKTAISLEEREYLTQLLQNPAFYHARGTANITAITQSIRDTFGIQRTHSAIRTTVCNYRKKS